MDREDTEPSEAQGYETNKEVNVRFYMTYSRFESWYSFAVSGSAWGPL